MEPRTLSSTKRSQCVLWAAERHVPTAIQEMFRTRSRKSAPARKTIRRWRCEYFDLRIHADSGCDSSPQITAEQKEKIKNLFNQNPGMSLRYAAAKTVGSRGTICNFPGKELKMFSYPLQLGPNFQMLMSRTGTERLLNIAVETME